MSQVNPIFSYILTFISILFVAALFSGIITGIIWGIKKQSISNAKYFFIWLILSVVFTLIGGFFYFIASMTAGIYNIG